ncbi:hypothetical protein WDU94_012051, partial [Cyamophila willieti]
TITKLWSVWKIYLRKKCLREVAGDQQVCLDKSMSSHTMILTRLNSTRVLKLTLCLNTGSPSMVQRLSILKKLPIHNGCVNCICWSQNGEYLLSGSDDHHLVITNATKNFKTEVRYQTNHRANIFNARFLPNRSYTNVISCSGDGLITFSDVSYPIPPSYLASDTNSFSCHTGTVYELTTIPQDPNTFLSAGEDYTVRCFDLRVKSKCHKMNCKDDILIQCQRAVTTISINEMAPYQMAIGTSDSTVRIFDRRMLGTISAGFTATNTSPVVIFTAPGLDNRPYRITSVAFSPDGQDVLASYSSEYLYLFNLGAPASPPRSYGTAWGEGEGEGGGASGVLSGDDVKACPVRRLRLRGDWSDTGPDARPEREAAESQTRPTVHSTVMQRMTDLLTRILNDPMTRAAISGADREMEQGGPIPSDDSEASNHGPDDDTTLERETTSTVFVHSMDSNPQSSSMDTETSTTSMNQETLRQPGPSMDAELGGTSELSSLPTESNSTPCDRMDANLLHTTSCMESEPITSCMENANTPQPTPSLSESPIRCSDNTLFNVNNTQNVVTSHSTVPSNSDDNHMLPSTSPPASVPSESDDLPTFHAVPSTSSTGVGEDMSSGMMGFSTFKDQLQDMREGYVKKHGKEPALVSLKVNNTGTMASSISFRPETSATGGPVESATSSGIRNTLTPSSSSPVRQHLSDTSSMSGDGDDTIEDEMDIDQSSGDEGRDQTTRPRFISSATIQPSRDYILTTEEPPDSYATGSGTGTSGGSSGGKRKQRGSGFNDEGAVRGIMKQKFTGHRNARTMIKQARFWGDSYVMSGSDCGHVFIWDRQTAALAMCLEGDKHVVNCVSAHPTLPLLATSGIDYDVKIWEPRLEEPGFDLAKAEELIKRNEIMLEETKDTITVPASFMIRMLACLNQIRRGGLNRGGGGGGGGRRGGSESAAE